MIYVGTADWNIPKIANDSFPEDGSHLVRYSQVLSAVEINSSFYKDHQPTSYKKWAKSTPENFRFSVKLNKRFTHKEGSTVDEIDLRNNLEGIAELGAKWGALLLQFPKSLDFNFPKLESMYQIIREIYTGPVALEARNMTWMTPLAVELMQKYDISKVTADPEKCNVDLAGSIKYYRLHGSPEIYISDYSLR